MHRPIPPSTPRHPLVLLCAATLGLALAACGARVDLADAQAPAQPPVAETPAPDGPSTHTIQSGDTFEGIAKQYGLTVRALRAANPGVEPRRLIPGKTLRLP